MISIDFDRLEHELSLKVPNIYRRFIDEVNENKFDLMKYGIYDNTDLILKGNRVFNHAITEFSPMCPYFDFGVGDGAGNYYFLKASSAEDNEVSFLCHDPGEFYVEGTAEILFSKLILELKSDFEGEYKYHFEGNGHWDFIK